MAGNSWRRPDPSLVAWAGLAAVVALLAVYTLAAPQPRRVIIERGPFDPPILLEELRAPAPRR